MNELEPIVAGAVNDLVDRSPETARAVIARAVHEAYRRGRRDALAGLLTTEQVAAMLGVTPGRVRQLAQKRGAGWHVAHRVWLFTSEDVAALQVKGRPGRRPGRRPAHRPPAPVLVEEQTNGNR